MGLIDEELSIAVLLFHSAPGYNPGPTLVVGRVLLKVVCYEAAKTDSQ